VVDALNGKQLFFPGPRSEFGDYDLMLRQVPLRLRAIVKAWLDSGPSLEQFRRTHPDICRDVYQYWGEVPKALVPLDDSGGAAIGLMPSPGRTTNEEALRFFVWLITNPWCDRLAGPCVRCGNYYIRGSVRNKLYCSRSCGTRATATAATKRARKAEHDHKLRQALEAIRKYEKAHSKIDWKRWVSAKEPRITPKFLTRAVNKGELKEPTRPLTESSARLDRN